MYWLKQNEFLSRSTREKFFFNFDDNQKLFYVLIPKPPNYNFNLYKLETKGKLTKMINYPGHKY